MKKLLILMAILPMAIQAQRPEFTFSAYINPIGVSSLQYEDELFNQSNYRIKRDFGVMAGIRWKDFEFKAGIGERSAEYSLRHIETDELGFLAFLLGLGGFRDIRTLEVNYQLLQRYQVIPIFLTYQDQLSEYVHIRVGGFGVIPISSQMNGQALIFEEADVDINRANYSALFSEQLQYRFSGGLHMGLEIRYNFLSLLLNSNIETIRYDHSQIMSGFRVSVGPEIQIRF